MSCSLWIARVLEFSALQYFCWLELINNIVETENAGICFESTVFTCKSSQVNFLNTNRKFAIRNQMSTNTSHSNGKFPVPLKQIPLTRYGNFPTNIEQDDQVSHAQRKNIILGGGWNQGFHE